ncbi:hypothetical protein ACTSEZ_16245 [Metabacillus sp. JX24]|uniref:hypothetical protein n=1 Tax=Metabacillus sp. JX24 TaxID=3240759 RepID=UPI00350FF794
MLIINESVKRRELPVHILHHLTPFPPHQVRFVIAVFTFLCLDLLLALPLYLPFIFNHIVLILVIPFISIINIWALKLLFSKVDKRELETLLFLGCLGLAGAICYFISGIKFLYMSGVTSYWYYMILALLFILGVGIFYRSYSGNFLSLEKVRKKTTPKWHYVVASIAAPAGYIVATLLIGVSNHLMVSFVTFIFFLGASLYSLMFVKFLHKYFLSRKTFI